MAIAFLIPLVCYAVIGGYAATRKSYGLSPSGPFPQNLAQAALVRQPYSVAVPSTGGRLHPSFLRREGLVRMWSSLWLKGDGGIRKSPSLTVRKDG